MTNQEAKRIIEEYLALDSDIDNEFMQAQRVAISALERQKCENCKILELLVDMEIPTICEDDDREDEYCYNHCDFKAPTKECYLHWANMRKDSEYHADPYHADFAWDVKTVIDNFRKESE